MAALQSTTNEEPRGSLLHESSSNIRPLAAVQGEGFREILHFFEPGYDIPSYKTLWNTIKHQYDSMREKIVEEMRDQTVSLTTDLWTSSTMEPYITVTAHYITDTWKLTARVLYLGCTGHTLQLAIKAGLFLPDVSKSIDAARRVVSHFRHSAVATCALRKRQEQLGIRPNKLQTDCAVRWNSTYIMIQRLFEQRIAVQSVLADETVTKPAIQKSLALRASHWEMLEQLIPVLQPLAKATEIMCAELHVGLSFIFPVIFNMISTTLRVEASDMTAVRAFKNTVRRQLETRFKLESDDLTESIPTVACMLDPRFKHLHFIPEDKREAAHSHLNRLVQDEPLAAKADDVNSEDTVEAPHIPTMENPLQWWARNHDNFPRLAKLCKRYLAVPATSTPSERIFSLAGNTISRLRASLHPAHGE
ncbi:unnamed protein product [Leuciscus chuanchicus]